MTKPLISVVLPAYNAEKFIEQTIRSVIHQTYACWELIVVDDGSTDGQNQIIGKLANEDERIQFYSTSNQGVSSARNYGIERSAGSYLAFLDADDIWLPDNLAVKLKKFENSEFGLVHSDAEIINDQGMPQGEFLRGKEGELLNDLLLWQGPHIPGPSSVLIAREALGQVGNFDPRLSTSADYDLFIRIASKHLIGRVPEVTWQYRVHAGNMHKNLIAMEKDLLLTFEKAASLDLFRTVPFERRCKTKLNLVLGMSWLGSGNAVKGLGYIFKAARTDIAMVANYFRSKL